jgi:hypothetical protein
VTGHPDLPVTDPAYDAGEREMLGAFLQAQRDLVAWKLADADQAVLQSSTTPTGLSALGLIRHLIDNERWWFRHRSAGEPDLTFFSDDADPDGDFRVPADASLKGLLLDYAAECRAADESVADRSLDQIGAIHASTLRWVYLHMIEETSRHLGHIDVLRELADGSTGADPSMVAAQAAGPEQP